MANLTEAVLNMSTTESLAGGSGSSDLAQKRLHDWENNFDLQARFSGDFGLYAASFIKTGSIASAGERQKSDSSLSEQKPIIKNLITATKKPQEIVNPEGEFALSVLRAWKNDESLRAEFQGNLKCYIAFCEAEKAGKVKVARGCVVR